MKNYQSLLSVMAICLSSSVANAQCKNGVCTIPSANPFTANPTGFMPSYSELPGTFQKNRSAVPNAACVDGRCRFTSVCPECDCDGEYCDCGPNCPAHIQPGQHEWSVDPSNGQSPYRNDFQLTNRNSYQGTLRAPRPTTNPYQPASYSVNVPWMSNYETGLAASRRSGRPMIVKISADWCRYCQQMKHQTYSDQGVVRTITSGFIPVALDGDIDRKLIQQLGVKTLPAVVIITPDLRIVDRVEGFKTPRQLTASLLRHRQRAQLDDVDMNIATR